MFKKNLMLFVFLLIFCRLSSREIKGLWVVRWDVDDPIKVFQMMDNIKKYDINTLFVQVYARGEAMYRSNLVPRSTELIGAPFNYDPLELILDLAHKEGYEVHAWINLYYIWSHAPFPSTENHIAHKHEDWFIGNEEGKSLRSYSVEEIKAKGLEGYFLEPGNPEVRKHLKSIVKEIVSNYDVDGLHMDYCRYPGSNFGYDVSARVMFMRDKYVDPMDIRRGSALVDEFGPGVTYDIQKKWDNWRREQVTLTIKEISDCVREINPKIPVSVAVIGDNTHAFNNLFQNWVRWARSDYVDFVVPMLYSTDVGWLERKTESIVKIIGRKKLVVGLGAYLQDYKNLAQEMVAVESKGVRGYLLFSYGGMIDKGYFD